MTNFQWRMGTRHRGCHLTLRGMRMQVDGFIPHLALDQDHRLANTTYDIV